MPLFMDGNRHSWIGPRWDGCKASTNHTNNSWNTLHLWALHPRIGNIHSLIDHYLVSVNPDVCFLMETYKHQGPTNSSEGNYKLVSFTDDGDGIAENYLDGQLMSDPACPVDQLLPWHFSQAVFAEMRGPGAPVSECDFPPGLDNVGEIGAVDALRNWWSFGVFGRRAQEVWFSPHWACRGVAQ